MGVSQVIWCAEVEWYILSRSKSSQKLGKKFKCGQKPQVSLGSHLKLSQIKLKQRKNCLLPQPVGLFNCIPLSSIFSSRAGGTSLAFKMEFCGPRKQCFETNFVL